MNARNSLAIAALALFIGGCATTPQRIIPLSQQALASKTERIGVGMTALPKVDTHLPGAHCLLCMATASIANSALASHAQTLPYEDIPKLKDQIAAQLRAKGMDVVVISEAINVESLPAFTSAKGSNIAPKDYSSLREKYKIDKLLVVDITMLGMMRTYSSYIPTGDPRAVLQGVGYIVNLVGNVYEWYMPVQVFKGADKAWDEPPKFPGLTNAYFQAIEVGKDRFLESFAN